MHAEKYTDGWRLFREKYNMEGAGCSGKLRQEGIVPKRFVFFLWGPTKSTDNNQIGKRFIFESYSLLLSFFENNMFVSF